MRNPGARAPALSRRQVLRLAGMGATALAGGALAGCSPAGAADGLRLYTYVSSADLAKTQTMLDAYEAEHPGVTIRAETVAGAGAALYPDKLRTSMLAGIPPDIFRMWGGELAGPFIDAEQVADLDPYYERYGWEERLIPLSVGYVRRHGSRWGLPAGLVGLGFWYRTDVFQRLGVGEPATYDELEAACTTLRAGGVVPLSTGGKYGWHVMRLVEYLLEVTAGPALHDQLLTLEASWDRPEVAEAYRLLLHWADQGWLPKGFLAASPQDAQIPWMAGDAAMMIEGSSFEGALKSKDQDLRLYGIFLPPTGHDPQRFSGYVEQHMIARDAPDPDAAAAFLDWTCQLEVQREHVIGGMTAVVGALPPAEDWPLTHAWQPLLAEHDSFLVLDQAFPKELADSFFAIQDQVAARESTPRQAARDMQRAIDRFQLVA